MPRQFKTKKSKQNQQYDSYWKLTVEYTDIFNYHFNNTLRVIINYIDENARDIKQINKELCNGEFVNTGAKERWSCIYNELQERINSIFPKRDLASVRKSINQFVKLGFIAPFLNGYHRLAKRFLSISADEVELKKSVFAEIFYEGASFNSAVTRDNTRVRQINFLLKTLLYHPEKKLEKKDIVALMVTDLANFRQGYLTVEQLEQQYNYSKEIHFEENKYNQISYMFNFLKLMPDLAVDRNVGIAFIEDGIILSEIDVSRDPYLHSLYKNNLKIESRKVYNDVVCYVEKISYKGLVASHLKPLKTCLQEMKVNEAYDYNNGVLIQPNIDAYVDKFDISFNDNGTLLFGNRVPEQIKSKFKSYSLDSDILTAERIKYIRYHRKKFEEKNAS